MIEDISTALQTLLPTIQVDGESLFVDVIPHPPTDSQGNGFTGFPSAAHFYDGTDSDYSTVTENRRDVVFALWIYAIWQDKPLPDQYALAHKYMDAVIDALDQSGDLGINQLMLRPVPGELRRVSTERGTGVMSYIRLVCSYDRQVQGFGS